jgi:hypothetical protein
MNYNQSHLNGIRNISNIEKTVVVIQLKHFIAINQRIYWFL